MHGPRLSLQPKWERDRLAALVERASLAALYCILPCLEDARGTLLFPLISPLEQAAANARHLEAGRVGDRLGSVVAALGSLPYLPPGSLSAELFDAAAVPSLRLASKIHTEMEDYRASLGSWKPSLPTPAA